MPRVLIIADETEDVRQLAAGLNRRDFTCSVCDTRAVAERLAAGLPDLVLLATDSVRGIRAPVLTPGRERRPPTIALASLETVSNINGDLEVDDFVLKPYDLEELVVRAKRLLQKTDDDGDALIRCGDLTIDTARCEVAVAGQPMMLTFKEYELLRFLASHPGRVFTREVLLDRVWGHDYFGGDRTVDVHIRRLRSKIEAFGHSFIDTVRNVGYAFSKLS